MNFRDCLSIGIKSLFRNNKKTKVNIFVVFISILTIMIVLTISNTISVFIKKNIENNIEYRSIFVKYDVLNDNLDNAIKRLSKVKHIYKVLEQNEYQTSIVVNEFKTSKTDGEIKIIASDYLLTPAVILGRTLDDQDSNTLVCPTKFIADGNVNNRKDIYKDDYIDGKEFLNKKIKVTYKSYDYSKEIPQVMMEYTDTFEIVGLYDTYDNYSGDNVCYANFSKVKELNKIMEGNLNEYSSEVFWYPIVIVDNANNVDIVISEISKLGYTPIKQINIDTKLISGIKSICYIITFSMLLMSFVNISLYIAKSINDRKREFGIYKTFGYRNKDILKLILSETLFVEILGFLLALIVYSVLYFIAYYVTNYSSVIFSRFIIEFSFVSICISLIYTFLLPCLYSLMFIKKIKNINPIDIINK